MAGHEDRIDQDNSLVNNNHINEQLEENHVHNANSLVNNNNVGLQARFNNGGYHLGETSNGNIIHQQVVGSPVGFTSPKSTSTAARVVEYHRIRRQNKETEHQVQNVQCLISSYNIVLDPQKKGPIGLDLDIQSLLDLLNQTSPQEIQQNSYQDLTLSQPQPEKIKAAYIPAVRLTIGSWQWSSKHTGDLAAKFYYGKKKIVWEFLYGDRKKKMEIRWAQVTAINTFVNEDDNTCLELELNEQPERFNEVNYQPNKHTKWGATVDDFTLGQALICRRHTVVFAEGVLDAPLNKLLQCDSRLLNLSQQPFPVHNSPYFPNQILDFSCNTSLPGSSSDPVVNNDYPSAMVPYVQNFVPSISSFAGHDYSHGSPQSVLNSPYLAQTVEVSLSDQHMDQQAVENNLFQQIPVTLIGEHNYILPSVETQPWTTNNMDSVDTHNSITFDTTLNHENVNMVDQPHTDDEMSSPNDGLLFDFEDEFEMDCSSAGLLYTDDVGLPDTTFDFEDPSSWQPCQMELAENEVDQN